MTTGLARDQHARGVALVVSSAILFASAGVFTKLIPSDAWTVLFWRGLLAAVFLAVLLAVRGGFMVELLGMGRSGLAAAAVNSLGSIAFIPAFKLTSVANVTLIYTAAPFVAALVAWLWLRERPTHRCLIAATVALAGVAVIFGLPRAGVSLMGECLALWMTLCMAVAMVIYRRYPETPVFGPIALSSVMVLPVGLALSDPFAVPAAEGILLVAFGVCFAFAAVALMAGARLLPVAETALVSLLETPLAPLLACLLLGEVPSLRSVMGGFLILLALIWYLVRKDQNRSGNAGPGIANPPA